MMMHEKTHENLKTIRPLKDGVIADFNAAEGMLREILQMVHQDILVDGQAIEKAYVDNNWDTIEKLAHKMKGGALYSGTIRMKYACQYLERYRKAGHTAMLDTLYHQLLSVLQETKQCIEHWLD